MGRILVVLLLLSFGVAPAAAENVSKKVRAGRTTTVYSVGWYNRLTCRPVALPNLKVRKKPKHGNVKFVRLAGRVGAKGGRCEGTTLPAMAVRYTPSRGYRGNDGFSVSYRRFVYTNRQNQTVSSVTFDIDVK